MNFVPTVASGEPSHRRQVGGIADFTGQRWEDPPPYVWVIAVASMTLRLTRFET
jgi:hypothetical protein